MVFCAIRKQPFIPISNSFDYPLEIKIKTISLGEIYLLSIFLNSGIKLSHLPLSISPPAFCT